jgi:hypothetical protein
VRGAVDLRLSECGELLSDDADGPDLVLDRRPSVTLHGAQRRLRLHERVQQLLRCLRCRRLHTDTDGDSKSHADVTASVPAGDPDSRWPTRTLHDRSGHHPMRRRADPDTGGTAILGDR